MLARDYSNVGSRGSIMDAWCTKDVVGKVGSVGSDQDGAITISDPIGCNVQAWRDRGMSRLPSLGAKGRAPGELMQPCQTALSADGTVLAVADSGNNRVQLFDSSTRKLMASVGRKGQIRPGRMQTPEGVVFVDGRCEIIVADTGNNRLQVFRIERKANPHDGSGIQTVSISGGGGGGGSRTIEGVYPPPSVENAPLSSGGPLTWTGSQAPPPPAKASSGQDQKRRLLQADAAGRGPEVPKPQERSSAPGTGQLGEDGDDASSRACLLVFSGGDNVERLRKRRTAGESDAAEGPMCQPCDLAYWRARRPGRGEEGHTAAGAWIPELPGWFWPHSSHHDWPGSSAPDIDDEGNARRALLSPPVFPPSQGKCVQRRGDNDRDERRASKDESTGGHAGGFVGDDAAGSGKPLLGAFVVRETGLRGELQLLFVAKTKEAEEAKDAADESEPENHSVSVLSGHVSEEYGSESLEWTKQAARSALLGGDEPGGHRDAEGRDGVEARSSSQRSSSTPSPTFEVREEFIAVVDEGKGVEIRGRVYDSLLSFLRGFRWGGLERLVGVSDTRGNRAVVAVAERGGGRVRLLHYAPAFPPFYATELTHLHSIEGLRRPSSVSFSPDGDLLVVDQGARKVLVYSHLSGKWVRVREFGPNSSSIGDARGGDDTDGGTDTAPGKGCAAAGRHARTENGENGREAACPNRPPSRRPNAGCVRTWSPGGERAVEAGTDPTGRRQEKRAEADHGEERQGRKDGGCAEGGAPVSARFVRLKKRTGLASCALPDDDCHRAETTELVVVLASADGVVNTLCGPKGRHCGRFFPLAEGTVLSIFELLGYRSSQVLGYVNRTLADLRSRLRREWRLHPLTPGQLARRTLTFVQWGRSSRGGGLHGRGKSVDARGKQLCDQFLSTSSCSRPACPYSHDQPWVAAISDTDADACIVFRGGATHAVNNLYGQVFGWEWEGELYRLFRERSFLRTMLARRDPMTLGVHGAEVIRGCVKKVDHVLDYPAFVDFLTVVHEHVLGLRSWHQRPAPAPKSQPSHYNTRVTATSSLSGLNVDGGQRERENNCGLSGSMVEGHRPAHLGATLTGGKVRAKEEIGVTSVAKQPSADTASLKDKTILHLPPLKGSSSSARKLETATPWLGWDFAASNDANTQEADGFGLTSGAVDSIPATGVRTVQHGKTDPEPDDHGHNDHEYDQKGQDGEEKMAEEPKTNRTYGGADNDDHGASVNKLFAFQTDRVVRMLDKMF